MELTSSTTSASPRAALTVFGEKFRHQAVSWRARQRRFQVLRTVPENALVRFRTKVNLFRWRMLLRTPMLAQHFKSVHAVRFVEDLRLLNDVLATTALRDRYWMWGGLLLGWARDGKILSHDVGDADFFYFEEFEKDFEDAQRALIEAGFSRWFCYRRSEDGRVAEQVFLRRGSKFEFFRLYDVTGGASEYHLFGNDGTTPTEYIGRFPRPELERFAFLDREWLKPLDHDDFLTRLYGDWRVPKLDWSFADDEQTLVRRRPWGPCPDRVVAAVPRNRIPPRRMS
jgi:hypothetical protein